MLTRRQARIKVMQQLYGYWTDQEIPVNNLQKSLRQQLTATYHAYLFALVCVREIAAYAHTYAAIQQGKLLLADDQKKVSTRIADTPIVQFLQQEERITKPAKKLKFASLLDEELFRRLFRELTNRDLYHRYADETALIQPGDDEILVYLFKEIMLEDEGFDQLMESAFPVWIDDYDIIATAVTQTLEGLARERFSAHDDMLRKLEEITSFAADLLEKTIAHRAKADTLIGPKLNNWDLERIALMDLLLMNMALTEILDMPTIPVKVTMNEYIDISKHYSTPKSKDFINGVLDKIVKDLKEQQQIFKTGRGLKE